VISESQILEWHKAYEGCKEEAIRLQMIRTLVCRVREDALHDLSAIAKKLNESVKLNKNQSQTGVHPRMMYHKFGQKS
jgi:hypothetical protein